MAKFLDEAGLEALWARIKAADDALDAAAAKIATGSYTGTGKNGSGSKNSLTFDFVPKFVVVAMKGANTFYGNAPILWWVNPDAAVTGQTSNSDYAATCSLSGTTLSWYNAKGVGYQLNVSGTVYRYIAIG